MNPTLFNAVTETAYESALRKAQTTIGGPVAFRAVGPVIQRALVGSAILNDSMDMLKFLDDENFRSVLSALYDRLTTEYPGMSA